MLIRVEKVVAADNKVEEVLSSLQSTKTMIQVGMRTLEKELEFIVQDRNGLIITKTEEITKWVNANYKSLNVECEALATVIKAMVYERAEKALREALLTVKI